MTKSRAALKGINSLTRTRQTHLSRKESIGERLKSFENNQQPQPWSTANTNGA